MGGEIQGAAAAAGVASFESPQWPCVASTLSGPLYTTITPRAGRQAGRQAQAGLTRHARLSKPPDSRTGASTGFHATACTLPVWWRSVCWHACVATSQTLTVLSAGVGGGEQKRLGWWMEGAPAARHPASKQAHKHLRTYCHASTVFLAPPYPLYAEASTVQKAGVHPKPRQITHPPPEPPTKQAPLSGGQHVAGARSKQSPLESSKQAHPTQTPARCGRQGSRPGPTRHPRGCPAVQAPAT